MPTLSKIKAEHLEQIKNYLREYLSKGHEVTFIEQKEDHYAAYMLIEQGLYTGGDYGRFESSDGTVLKALLINENYKLKSPVEKLSYQYFYQADDFYKHLQYDLAVKLLTSIKE
jgi:hypothetical protein